MNIHHLELFYYVAKHGGISEAVRKIPYGIQQPAVSAQILQLEDTLGVTLFTRRPFALTSQGTRLFGFIQPFFENLDAVAADIRGGSAPHLRVGASQLVLRDHLPEVISEVQAKLPGFKITLREGYQPQLEAAVQRQELDLALTLVEGKPPAGVTFQPLIKLPLILIVATKSKIKSATELFERGKVEEPLLTLPPEELICRRFQQGLAKLGVDWFPSMEMSSLEIIGAYVQKGYGVGLSIKVPGGTPTPGIRILPLDGFEPVEFGALWHGKLTPVLEAFIEGTKRRASKVATLAP